MDLRAYCNTAPYMISEAASAPRTYRLFRTLGLRHLLVINHKVQPGTSVPPPPYPQPPTGVWTIQSLEQP